MKAGLVSGSFFDVMGLRQVLGRLLNAQDDGPMAAGVAVLTYRFWSTSLRSDPAVVGRTICLGPRDATVVGVLESSVPYPADTEIFANVVTSPHHLGAAMVTSRTHRMTELFGRLEPEATLDAARTELTAAHAALMREHPEAYAAAGGVRLGVSRLRDQMTSPARTAGSWCRLCGRRADRLWRPVIRARRGRSVRARRPAVRPRPRQQLRAGHSGQRSRRAAD